MEIEYRPQMLAALQSKVDAVAAAARGTTPACPRCGRLMRCQDTREISGLARCARRLASVSRYRCPPCRCESRPSLDLLGVEPGRVRGALARLLAVLATVVPSPLAARLAWLRLGVTIRPMGIWRGTQRLGEAAAHHREALSQHHGDSRSSGAAARTAKRRRHCRPLKKAVSARSRPASCYYPASEWKPPLEGVRWCAAFS